MEPPAYERDPFLRRLRAQVVDSGADGRPWVVLSDTLFYPEGGGQPCDRGWINGVAVRDVQKAEDRLVHWLASPVPPGPAELELDWARRFDHMQQHTGQHLLTAVAAETLGWRTTAFHLGESVSDIEIDAKASPEAVAELEERVAAEIRNARPVTARRVSPEEFAALEVRTRGLPEGHTGPIRLVEIQGLDLNTCGGTHLTSTAQLETLKILGTEGMRGGTRLTYVAGGRVRRLLARHESRNARLRQMLGTGDDNLAEAVSLKVEQAKDALREVRKLREQRAASWAARLAESDSVLVSAHLEDADMAVLQRAGRAAVDGAAPKVCLLTGSAAGSGEGFFVLSANPSSRLDVAAAGGKIAEILEGRGGGSGNLFQGKCKLVSNRERAVQRLQRFLGDPGSTRDPDA